jgi:DNA polymerase (family 10)
VRSRHISSDADLGPLLDAPPDDLDPELLRQLRHMYEAGAWVLLESALADLPADLRWLFESGAVTLEQLAALHHTLGAATSADLQDAVRREAIRRVPGLDAGIEQAVAQALPSLRSGLARVPLGRAVAIAAPILDRLRQLPGVASAQAVGSLRRGQDMIGDIELLAPADAPGPVLDEIAALPDIARHLHRGERRLYLLFDRVQVGIRCPRIEVAGAALLHLTGSPRHYAALAQLARDRGGSLEPEGLVTSVGGIRISATEEDIYAALGLPFIPPELREDGDEIAAAREGRLPALVARPHIRGDLHMHSDWSDGRDSIEAMVQGCVSLGYEYMAITDHSPHSAAARNLTLDGVPRQAEEIARLRERFPQIQILHGCEVDILAQGKLDFPDSTLRQFDIVLASLHEEAGHSREQLMQRYLTAIRHPLVTIITHPTNRLVPHRRGYDLDYDRLIAAAVEHGTILEVDGAPSHLDMDGELTRRAISAGATVAIDSDCHRAEMLDRQMTLGLMTARRGWAEPQHVLNTRPLADVRAWIAAKRAK